MLKIVMYATMKNGDGHVEKIGEFEDLEEIRIRIGIFTDDVVITFEEEEIYD